MHWRDRIATASCLAAIAAGCGGDDRADGDSWHGGMFAVTPNVLAQPCGDAVVTFTAEAVVIRVESRRDVLALWSAGGGADPGWFGPVIPGTLDDRHFELFWESSREDVGPCPSTGDASIVTTFTNEWRGYAASDAAFDSLLDQHIEDDCAVVGPCTITWGLHGERVSANPWW